MNVIKHTKYIWELENFISDEDIDHFLGMVDFFNPVAKHNFRTEVRANDTYDLTEVEELDNIAWDWIRKASQYYVTENDFCFYKWDKLQLFSDSAVWSGQNILRQYNENDFYEWHGDQSPSNLSEFSFIIYLNDDFDGGDTKFMNDKIRVSPKKGSVLCFPVDHYHIHKGMKVSNGLKRIIWNCVYRDKITVQSSPPYATLTNVPRSTPRCIW